MTKRQFSDHEKCWSAPFSFFKVFFNSLRLLLFGGLFLVLFWDLLSLLLRTSISRRSIPGVGIGYLHSLNINLRDFSMINYRSWVILSYDAIAGLPFRENVQLEHPFSITKRKLIPFERSEVHSRARRCNWLGIFSVVAPTSWCSYQADRSSFQKQLGYKPLAQKWRWRMKERNISNIPWKS